jgi:hypothetical protein
MANVAGVAETSRNRRRTPPSTSRASPASAIPSVPIATRVAAPGMHPRAFRLPMIAAAWFLISMAISFAGTLETAYLMAIIVGFAIIFFGLAIGLAMHASGSGGWLGSGSSFRRFVGGEVTICTGRISGREAMLQLTVLPVTLALGGMTIGLVYLLLR